MDICGDYYLLDNVEYLNMLEWINGLIDEITSLECQTCNVRKWIKENLSELPDWEYYDIENTLLCQLDRLRKILIVAYRFNRQNIVITTDQLKFNYYCGLVTSESVLDLITRYKDDNNAKLPS